MLIRSRPSWFMPESQATPEKYFLARRSLLQAAGLLTISGALSACSKPASNASNAPEAPDPSASLYPFKKNANYVLDRPVTDEKNVASYNNYYEFGYNKDDPEYYAKSFPIRPWEISFDGLVE